jgi:hypothetical protein
LLHWISDILQIACCLFMCVAWGCMLSWVTMMRVRRRLRNMGLDTTFSIRFADGPIRTLGSYELSQQPAWPRTAVHSSPACARSQALLREWLTPEQREFYDSSGSFGVIGEATGTLYRINCREPQFNVHAIDENGTEICRLCFEPQGALPPADRHLAQKLALETCERGALLVANANIAKGFARIVMKLPEVASNPETIERIQTELSRRRAASTRRAVLDGRS